MEKDVYEILNKLNIKYKITEHEAFYSSEDADKENYHLDGLNLKNLLIKDKRREDFYLIIMDEDRRFDSKDFKELTSWTNKTRFANDEELYELLKLKPGSVSPFGIINDKEAKVIIVIDNFVTSANDEEIVNFHPNINTKTLSLTKKDFYKFLNNYKNKILEEKK